MSRLTQHQVQLVSDIQGFPAAFTQECRKIETDLRSNAYGPDAAYMKLGLLYDQYNGKLDQCAQLVNRMIHNIGRRTPQIEAVDDAINEARHEIRRAGSALIQVSPLFFAS